MEDLWWNWPLRYLKTVSYCNLAVPAVLKAAQLWKTFLIFPIQCDKYSIVWETFLIVEGCVLSPTSAPQDLGLSLTFLSHREGVILLTILPSFERQRPLSQSFVQTHCPWFAGEIQFGSNTKALSTHLEHKMSYNCFKAMDCWVNVCTFSTFCNSNICVL